MIVTMVEAFAAGRTRWRRARNLRAAGSARERVVRTEAAAPALRRLAIACVLLILAGAVVIVMHAQRLVAAADEGNQIGAGPAALRSVLAGATFTVPPGPSVQAETHGGATLLLLSGMRAGPARQVDLCSQLADPAAPGGRILPVHVGLRFADAAALAARGIPLRNAMLATGPMPRLTVAGTAATDGLALRWDGGPARWIGAAGAQGEAGRGQAALGREGWLLWRDGALRITRRAHGGCAAGELVLRLYRPGTAATALAIAYPADGGAAVEAMLAPGSYRVPAAPPALEDEQLFERLRDRGLVRLGRDGLAELAPPDLLAWRALGKTPWDEVMLDDDARRLLERLYHRADGDFVRAQVRIFNGERRLLAWRLAGADGGAWTAQASGVPVAVVDDMPPAASRLFDRLPAGWAPWRRIDGWPGAGRADSARITLALPRTGATLRLMLAGRLTGVTGARLASEPVPACLGRGCRRPDDVQVLDLAPDPGATSLVLDVAPLATDALAAGGDARYRHLVLRAGRLDWQALPAARARAQARQAAVELADRAGRPLWRDGAPTEAARAAGLSSLLGLRAGQQGSVAAMLARLPGDRHAAHLTVDLDLQAAAQAALDCIAMRRGAWDGHACHGGAAPPDGRQAGLVVLDAETGAILAAAGSGMGVQAGEGDWRELRDFDRMDPAASPLRLPAWQHDGGAERSPGSTFKIVSALGLELAAQRDRKLDALLDGQPLGAINAVAAEGGWAFRTDAPTYPFGARVHITNFRDQGLDRRAHDGRLGLAQALTYSLNTWFAWTGELADASLAGRPDGGAPDLQPLDPDALDAARPVVAMARRLGFGQALRLDGGLLPADYAWSAWDALQATPAGIDPVHTRHELRQMAIGLRMQATPLQMALAAAAVGEGRVVTPHLLAALDGRQAVSVPGPALGVRLDRIRAGMKGVVDGGTAAGAFRGADLAAVRRGLSGKTGTAPIGDGSRATVWFTGWLEPHSLPGQAHRLALAVFVSRSEATGGEHAAPVAAAVLRSIH